MTSPVEESNKDFNNKLNNKLMAKTGTNSSRNTSYRSDNRAKPFVPKSGFTRTRREYGNGGRAK